MERFACVIFLSTLVSWTSSDIPFRNASLPWQVRVEDVVGRLTIQEIQAQLASGQGATPPISRLGIGEYSWWTNCGRGDVGQNSTAFPQAIGIGASFDKDLIYRVAEASSTEVRAYYNYFVKMGSMGIHKALSCWNPNMDLYRDPRWGRGPETLSEDPYHAGEMGYHHVKGLHGNHPRYVRTASACKHFDVSAGPEDWPVSRHDFDAKVSERDWRSYFLPPFRKCAEAGSFGLHCAYNLINGVPACANKKLLTDILRGEWNFTGYVASDAGALLTSITEQHYFNNTVDAAAGCLNAGCGLEVQGGDTRVYDSIIDAIHQNKVTKALVREQMKPLLYTRLRLGEFDPREMNPYNYLDIDDVVLSSTHRQLAVEAATKSFVLLKNTNSFLPIKTRYNHIAVVGPMANDSQQVFGDYAPSPDPRYITSPLSGLVRLGTTATHAAGCSSTFCTDYSKTDVVKALQGADVVFVCLGTGPAVESEGHDRHNISLPGQQLQLLQDVVGKTDKPVVLLLFNGGPVHIGWGVENQRVVAILECFYPAQAAGDAIFASLTNAGVGSVPAARLPYTWPSSDNQIPPMVNYSMAGRTYWYFDGEPAFPYGYGLSYTTFRYADFTCDITVMAGEGLWCSVTVYNTGSYDADEVSQVYMSWQNTSLPVPRIQLVGFTRRFIISNGSAVYEFTLDPKNMAVWTDDEEWVVLPGAMNIYVGGQQPNQRTSVGSNVEHRQFQIIGTKILGKY
ncbi:probable beta-D-xylosidase 2 [Haliotis rufescens]|uniref:probable beta-D-xylosidase 2 n=1 Tax=Haliotis rufescens TaxID=6454 RepID=UPI00201E7F7A|nr:probable beta-D-xylosidase 2 [Haliotis rufescens]